MREFILFSLTLLYILHVKASLSEMNIPEYRHKEEVKKISTSQNKFTRDLYQALAKGKDGNLFFSPFSVATALSMTYMGSKGETDAQMKSVLHLPAEKSTVQKAYHDLVTDYKTEKEEYVLKTSNMMYISNKLSVLDEFFNALTNDFLASSKLVDFDQAESVRQEINKEVEKETNNKIKDLIASGVLSALTRMVLVNAIYFKGLWLHQFDPKRTENKPFWITANTSVDVPMMTVVKEFRVTPKDELNATMLAMDYKGGRLSFVILLPTERDGLAALEQKLASVDFETLDMKSATSKVSVSLPRFKLEESFELVSVLKSMGMKDIFSPAVADLSGISGGKDLFVSNVIHKAFLEVNEEGAEAAAATGVVMATRALPMIIPFVADHPFFFYIRDHRSGLICFAGRVTSPVPSQDRRDEF